MLKRLICPDCKNKLTCNKSEIHCRECGRIFKTFENIPILLPKKLSKFKRIEIEFYHKEFEGKGDNFNFVESDWDRNSFGLLDFMEAIEKYPKNSKILELGAGNGQYSLILNKRGFRNLFVSDISVNGLAAAKKYAEQKSISFFVLDSEHIPFEHDTFDIVFLAASLHHLSKPEKGIAEMKRCAKKGGLVIVAIEPNSWYYYIIRPIAKLLKIRRIDRSKDSFSVGDETTHGFSMGKLKRYFRNNKIDIVKTQRVWYLTGIVYYFPVLVNRLFNITFRINPGVRKVTLRIDRIIGKIPILNFFSFHNTMIGVKR